MKAPQAQFPGAGRGAAAQEQDVPVAQLDQIAGGQVGAGLVVRHDVAAVFAVVHPQVNAGEIPQNVPVAGLGLGGDGRDQHAVHLAGRKVLNSPQLLLRLPEGIAQKHPVAVGGGSLFNGGGHAGKIGVGNIGHH